MIDPYEERPQPEPSEDFNWEAVEDAAGVCMEDLDRIAKARKIDPTIPITRPLAELVLAWGAEKRLGPSEEMLTIIGLWIGGSRKAEDFAFRAACFVHLFAPTARHRMTIDRIATVCGKTRSWITTTCRHLRATLYGGRLWIPSGSQIRARRLKHRTHHAKLLEQGSEGEERLSCQP